MPIESPRVLCYAFGECDGRCFFGGYDVFRAMCDFLVALAGCTDEAATQPSAPSAARRVRLATTTSVDNSGLLNELLQPL